MGIIRPTFGRIFFNGEDITDLGVDERARKGISYAFQQPVKFKGMKVFELVSLAAGRELTKDDACEYLSEVGLSPWLTSPDLERELSGGS